MPFFYRNDGKGTVGGKTIFSLVLAVVLLGHIYKYAEVWNLVILVAVVLVIEMMVALHSCQQRNELKFLGVTFIFCMAILSLGLATVLDKTVVVELVAIAITCDSFANFFGKKISTSEWYWIKIPYPKYINKKKSVTAAMLGIFFTALIYGVVRKIFPQEYLNFEPFQVEILATLAAIGDATFSYCKRHLNVGDFVATLGPIGGLSDRVDSWVFLFPAACIFLN